MKRYSLLLLAATVVFVTTGCVDLKGITAFSTSGAKTCSVLPAYGYTRYCFDSCYINNRDSPYVPGRCDLSHAVRYDTILHRESAQLVAYFNALAQLSGSDAVIDVDTIGGSISAGTYGQFTVTATDVQVFQGLTTGLRDLLTAGVKSKDIRQNLQRFGGEVAGMIDSLILQYSALDGLTGNLVIGLNTQLIVYGVRASPGPQRYAVLYAYNEKIGELKDADAQQQRLIAQLSLVEKGYRQLAANAGNLRSKTLKQRLLALVNNISFLSGKSNP